MASPFEACTPNQAPRCPLPNPGCNELTRVETQLHRPKRGVTKQSKMQALGDEERRGMSLLWERPRPAPKIQLVVYTLDLAGYQAA
ncbi:hypothetical protein [uncultured Arthrobacter sp.]|uniref:hypothetical protein n=1 Tax=uncultured Arthrobacter sp. TaxID=114050 RepID=UPI0028D49CD6|nr:hypothetical protein [uncultured Arthrobacter sp.]